MRATDLKCSECGTGARDVDLSLEFDDKTAVYWTCQNGHKKINGWRPEIVGLAAMLDKPQVYQPVQIDTASLTAGLDSESRRVWLDTLETRIDAMHASAVERLAEGIFYSPPVFLGMEWKKPSHWMWRTKVRWWWRDARERFAVKVLRVDIYQGEDS